MATDDKTRKAADGPDAAAAAPAGGGGTELVIPWGEASLYEYGRGGGKKKRKYSRGWKDPQILERDVSKSANRLARAAADGLGRYRRERDRSARRKKNGAIKDFVRNVGRGTERALRRGSKVPSDLTRRATSKRLRRTLRLVPVPPFFWVRP